MWWLRCANVCIILLTAEWGAPKRHKLNAAIIELSDLNSFLRHLSRALLGDECICDGHRTVIYSSIEWLLLCFYDCHIVLVWEDYFVLTIALLLGPTTCCCCWNPLRIALWSSIFWHYHYKSIFQASHLTFVSIILVPYCLVAIHLLKLHLASWLCLLWFLRCNVQSGLLMVMMPLFPTLVPSFVYIHHTFSLLWVAILGVFSGFWSVCECICCIQLGIEMFPLVFA